MTALAGLLCPFEVQTLGWVWCQMPVIPDTQEVGGYETQGQPGQFFKMVF